MLKNYSNKTRKAKFPESKETKVAGLLLPLAIGAGVTALGSYGYSAYQQLKTAHKNYTKKKKSKSTGKK